ncbi:hypothetical protein PTE_04665 [Photorhabdus khanii NC19]|uniref:Uncharacterized protein n=1 Tax=Photorhabdus khanii NC19 TaxID=1004151 RepID=W3V309_9GAMM|nr:hypothetical protein PTE_04665 [Photorhabdus khanii NC19]
MLGYFYIYQIINILKNEIIIIHHFLDRTVGCLFLGDN